jgi:hypothetical protein
MGWAIGEGREIYILHNVQTGSGANPASYTMGTGWGGGDFPGDKAAGAWS